MNDGKLDTLIVLFNMLVESYRSLEHNTRGEPDKVVSLAKWRILNRLHDRNETLYYRVRLGCNALSGIGGQCKLVLIPGVFGFEIFELILQLFSSGPY